MWTNVFNETATRYDCTLIDQVIILLPVLLFIPFVFERVVIVKSCRAHDDLAKDSKREMIPCISVACDTLVGYFPSLLSLIKHSYQIVVIMHEIYIYIYI